MESTQRMAKRRKAVCCGPSQQLCGRIEKGKQGAIALLLIAQPVAAVQKLAQWVFGRRGRSCGN